MKSEEEEKLLSWSHVLRAQSDHLEVLKLPKKEFPYFTENLSTER